MLHLKLQHKFKKIVSNEEKNKTYCFSLDAYELNVDKTVMDETKIWGSVDLFLFSP